tara:strand:- start:324 stop:497 length:174 start_codon:yes stop_codon:yes gene_type:complete
MIKKYKVLMSETFSVLYSVVAKDEDEAIEKIRNGDYEEEIENTPEEYDVCLIEEVKK